MVVRVETCESCKKLFRLDKLEMYQPRKGSRLLLLCRECHVDFLLAEKYIQWKVDEMKKEDE